MQTSPGSGIVPPMRYSSTALWMHASARPYAWSEALADQLESGRLLTWEGNGHTAYGRGGSCVTDAVDTYLLTGQLPEEGLRCSGSK